jgi:hypothetical protein
MTRFPPPDYAVAAEAGAARSAKGLSQAPGARSDVRCLRVPGA